ncbi:hypothetical protein JCM3770_005662 [Rhodotorula araucariae]
MAKGARHELKGKGKARPRERTRGDKPRLIEDPQLEERLLTAQLRDAGLYAANILGDGNCLFRALSDQLYGSPSMHHAIRQEICDYLAANPDKYRLFVDEDSVKGGFDGHVREMRQNGTYGTNIELSAFVARYRRPVKVYQPNLVYVMPVEEQGPSAAASSSSPPPPPPPAHSAEDKLTPREKRLKARQEKLDVKGKGKGRSNAKASAPTAAPALQASSMPSEPFDDSPLCIVYHSWEHYSSLRNISGPHTGPPRLRVGRVSSPAVDVPTTAEVTPQDADAAGSDQPEEADDEDLTMAESAGTASPAPPPPERKRRTPRGTPRSDHPLPAVRSALAHSAASPPIPAQPTVPIPAPSDLSVSPSMPPSPPASSSDPARPAKHFLDRSRPRSHSPLSSSSSLAADPDPDPGPDLDANDNDRTGPRTRSRLASPASSSSSSGSSGVSGTSTSTGVASSFAASDASASGSAAGGQSDGSTRATSVPPSSGEVPALQDGRGGARPRTIRPALPPPPPPSPRARRGPTSAQKKELARERRMDRRRAKGPPPSRAAAAPGGDADGRLLRSGRRSVAPADAGLGRVRELYI